jgi:hypothetical protein
MVSIAMEQSFFRIHIIESPWPSHSTWSPFQHQMCQPCIMSSWWLHCHWYKWHPWDRSQLLFLWTLESIPNSSTSPFTSLSSHCTKPKNRCNVSCFRIIWTPFLCIKSVNLWVLSITHPINGQYRHGYAEGSYQTFQGSCSHSLTIEFYFRIVTI